MGNTARWTWQQGIKYLQQERAHPTHNWYNMCLGLYTHSRGFSGGLDCASSFGRSVPSRYKNWNGKPIRGACVVWETNGWGHIATGTGDGYVLCNNDSGGVSKISLDYYSGLGNFWWAPGDAPIFGSMVGINEQPAPIVSALVPPKPVVPVPPKPIDYVTVGDTLGPAQKLHIGQQLASANGNILRMQSDGNLVVYRNDGRAVWATSTNKNGGTTAVVSASGVFKVLDSKGQLLWRCYPLSKAKSGSKLVMQSDCNLVLYGPGGAARWATYTK